MNKYLKEYIRNRTRGIQNNFNIKDYEINYIDDFSIDFFNEVQYSKFIEILSNSQNPYIIFYKLKNKNDFKEVFNFYHLNLRSTNDIEIFKIIKDLDTIIETDYITELFYVCDNPFKLKEVMGDNLFYEYLDEYGVDYFLELIKDNHRSYHYDDFYNMLKGNN